MQTNERDCAPTKFDGQKQAVGQIWLPGHSLPSPAQDNSTNGMWEETNVCTAWHRVSVQQMYSEQK